jgi:hypothetical protein
VRGPAGRIPVLEAQFPRHRQFTSAQRPFATSLASDYRGSGSRGDSTAHRRPGDHQRAEQPSRAASRSKVLMFLLPQISLWQAPSSSSVGPPGMGAGDVPALCSVTMLVLRTYLEAMLWRYVQFLSVLLTTIEMSLSTVRLQLVVLALAGLANNRHRIPPLDRIAKAKHDPPAPPSVVGISSRQDQVSFSGGSATPISSCQRGRSRRGDWHRISCRPLTY